MFSYDCHRICSEVDLDSIWNYILEWPNKTLSYNIRNFNNCVYCGRLIFNLNPAILNECILWVESVNRECSYKIVLSGNGRGDTVVSDFILLFELDRHIMILRKHEKVLILILRYIPILRFVTNDIYLYSCIIAQCNCIQNAHQNCLI